MSLDPTLPGQTDWITLLIILGLTVVTIVSRSLFFLSSRELPMPRWFKRGLQYAPAAALASASIQSGAARLARSPAIVAARPPSARIVAARASASSRERR